MTSAPLLLLDNEALLRVLGNGTFKIQTITFEDAKGSGGRSHAYTGP